MDIQKMLSDLGGRERLAICRITTGLYALWYLLPRSGMFAAIFRGPEDLFAPVGLAHILSGPLPPEMMDGLYVLTLVLGLVFTLGAAFRWTGPAFAVALLALLSYRNSWSMILHMHNLLVVHVGLLAFARSAEAWSVDAALRRGSRGASEPPEVLHWSALRWLSIVTTVPYVLSGLAKILSPSGIAWASGDVLRDQIAVNAIRYYVLMDGASSELFSLLSGYGGLFTVMGISTLVLELGAPIALWHPRLGRLWVGVTWGLHVGIYLVMGIVFRHQLTFVAFVPLLLYSTSRRPGPWWNNSLVDVFRRVRRSAQT